ncbi:glutaredoxin family protein [Candidatus Dojkabacteria bacterium]|jgi:glutaredoxin|nr:glutaredoxin family protein [Candidatus Dojkabacteria bacterium]
MKKILILIIAMFMFPFVAYAQTTAVPISAAATAPSPVLTLYVREGCTHCATVKAFISKYNITDKVTIVETLNVQTAITELNAWYDKFKLTTTDRGVPFLVVDGSSYYEGDTPIIDYLTKTFSITVVPDTTPVSTTDTLFVVIGGLILFSILGYGIYTMIGKKK